MDNIKRISELEAKLEEMERKGLEETELFEELFEEWSDLYTDFRLAEAKAMGFNSIPELISFEKKAEAKYRQDRIKERGATIPNLTRPTLRRFMTKFVAILSETGDWVWGRAATLEVVRSTPEFIEIARQHNRSDLGIHVWNHMQDEWVSLGKMKRAKVGSKVFYKLA